MLVRRILGHLKSQNWVAIALDLIVVVVGIFLGFQVDRWYDGERRAAEEAELLLSLDKDFSVSQERLANVIRQHTLAAESALYLLSADDESAESFTYEDFYTRLGHVQWTITPNVARSTYDLLIASGDINIIRNESLKSEMASFFAVFDGRGRHMADELREFSSFTWLPYVNGNLDHVALLQKVHESDTSHLSASRAADHYRAILGTPEFEGIIAAKWHLSHDYVFNLTLMLDSVVRIRTLLAESIAGLSRD